MGILRADQLKVGDYVDLEGDPIADPDRDTVAFEFEWQEVASVEQETPDCIVIGLEGSGGVGFPPNHLIKVRDQ